MKKKKKLGPTTTKNKRFCQNVVKSCWCHNIFTIEQNFSPNWFGETFFKLLIYFFLGGEF